MNQRIFEALACSVSLLCFSIRLSAQEPVAWTYTATSSGNNRTVQLTAKLQPGWHIYSQTQPPGAIVAPTEINFNKNALLHISGKPKEIGKLQKYKDETLGVEANQYSSEVSFAQTVIKKSKVKTNVTGSITYQLCTDEKCLPPKTISFSVQLE